MKTFGLFLVLVFGLISLLSGAATPMITIYSNPYHGVSFQYPTEWKCETLAEDPFSVVVSNRNESDAYHDRFRAFTISVSYSLAEVTVASELYLFKQNIEQHPGCKITDEGFLQINGTPFVQITYSYQSEGKENFVTDYMTTAGKRIIILTRYELERTPLTIGDLHDIIYSYSPSMGYTDEERHWADTLVLAAWRSNFPKVKELIAAGASANSVNAKGLSVLQAAATQANFELFSCLIELGADPHYVYGLNGTTAIFWVNWNLNNRGKINFYQLLIDKGVDLNVVNHKGKTIYQVMKEQVYLKDDAKFLKSKGAK